MNVANPEIARLRQKLRETVHELDRYAARGALTQAKVSEIKDRAYSIAAIAEELNYLSVHKP